MGRRNQKKQTMAAVHVRVRPSVKAVAVRLAQEDNRSLANWLERLIEAEAARLDGKKWCGGSVGAVDAKFVGWAKARLRRAHQLSPGLRRRDGGHAEFIIGRAFARPGGFAHPTTNSRA
jgi:hypothetical protein